VTGNKRAVYFFYNALPIFAGTTAERFMKKIFLLLLLLTGCIIPQEKMNLLQYLIRNDPDLKFIIPRTQRYEPQILYTQINRDDNNKIYLTTLNYNVNETEYFYPASSIKLPVAILALEKLNELNIKGLNKYTRMKTDSAWYGQTAVDQDTSSETGYPSIAHYIKKIFLVSDNDAYNRLYEFLGQEYINSKLHSKGYVSAKIVHRVGIALPHEENKCTNPVTFFDIKGDTIYHQSLVCNNIVYENKIRNTYKGIGYIEGDSLIHRPKDFSRSNFISLPDLQRILIAVMYPEAVDQKQRFNLTGEDYKFLYRYMSMLPSESMKPSYDTTYYDSYAKFLLFGATREKIPNQFRIFNKIGLAYGYLIDNAYIIDFKNNVEFFLSAVIYVNDNGIFNDNNYEYDSTGFPFLHYLGRTIYNYELIREKKKWSLERFIIDYNERDTR
jgi:hypothetical protein